MATSFITTFRDVTFLSELGDIELSTDLEKVVVGLYNDGDYGYEIYSTTLYSASRKVVLCDVRDLAESFMLKYDKTYMNLTVTCSDTENQILCEYTFPILFSTHIIPIDAKIFASSSFLTTLSSKRTSPGSTEYLSVMHDRERSYMEAHCVYRNEQGRISTSIVTLFDLGYEYPGVDTVIISYDDIVGKLAALDSTVAKLLAYTITWGGRTFTFYVHDSNADVSFTFKNCFNVLETISLHAVTTTKTKIDRELALLRSKYAFYDQTTEKVYEVQTSPLTMDEAGWMEQLLCSRLVRLGTGVDASSLPLVLITDSSSEITDSNAELNRVKFTWRFQDKPPHNLNVAVPDERIHQEQFTYQYQ